MDVMKREPENIEEALRHAIKLEAFEQSLMLHNSDDAEQRCPRWWPRNVYSLADPPDAGKTAAVWKQVGDLQQHWHRLQKVWLPWPQCHGPRVLPHLWPHQQPALHRRLSTHRRCLPQHCQPLAEPGVVAVAEDGAFDAILETRIHVASAVKWATGLVSVTRRS